MSGPAQPGPLPRKAPEPAPDVALPARVRAPTLSTVLCWLVPTHAGLDVLLHPNTGDALGDHRNRALWLGHSHALNLSGLGC